MSEFEKEEDKLLMIKVMEEQGWIESGTLNNSSSYEEVEEEHNRMVEEYDAIEYEIGNCEDD